MVLLLIANSALLDRTESSKTSSMLVIGANKEICRQMTGSCFLFWLVNFGNYAVCTRIRAA